MLAARREVPPDRGGGAPMRAMSGPGKEARFMANGTVEHPRTRQTVAGMPPRSRRSTNGNANGNGANGNGRHVAAKPTTAKPALGKPLRAQEQFDERKLLDVLTSLRKGNFTPRLRVKWSGDAGRIADTVNELMDVHQRFVREMSRLSQL